MRNPYEVLGISESASDEEVKAAYRALAKKYHPDNYAADNPLADLAEEKMKEINEAYDTICRMREGKTSGAGNETGNGTGNGGYRGNTRFHLVREMLDRSDYRSAEGELDRVTASDRDAEWHYLKSACLYHRGQNQDALRELDLACRMDPSNAEYASAWRMVQNRSASYGSAYRDERYQDPGARPAVYPCCNTCDCCTCLSLDCCCESLGGDCIPCI